MSQIIASFAHSLANYERVEVPVQVFDAKSTQVFAGPVPLTPAGSPLPKEFEAGDYLVRAVLPSGEIMANTVTLEQGKDGQALFKPKSKSPREELSWAYYLQKAPLPISPRPVLSEEIMFNPRKAEPIASHLDWWLHDANGWRVISESTRKELIDKIDYGFLEESQSPRISISFRKGASWTEFPGQVWLQFRTPAGSVFTALPTVERLAILVGTRQDANTNLPIRVQTSTGNAPVEALLGFLVSGDFASARAIASSWNETAKRLLYEKIEDPMSAAVGGYFLLQAGELDLLQEWTANLSEWFKWLPDGPIIRACHLMTRPSPDPKQVRSLFLESMARGLPYYTIGLRLLLNKLKVLLQLSPRDEELSSAISTVCLYMEAAEPASSNLSFAGEGPDRPESLWKQATNARSLFGTERAYPEAEAEF